jgi:aminoglycoside 3-N-acetyltransferase
MYDTRASQCAFVPHLDEQMMSTEASVPKRSTVTKADIVAALQGLGLGAGDVVMVHSSLSSMGFVAGGADTVIDGFLEVIGASGTLVMPTLCQKDKERRFETWNIATSPSDVGRITEVFRLRPGVIRSDHATHSVAACGPRAVEIAAGHKAAGGRPGPWGEAAFGHGSPWEKFYEMNVEYVFLGITMRVNTMRHFIQSRIVEDHLQAVGPERRQQFLSCVHQWYKPGVWPNYDDTRMEERLTALGLIRFGRIGNAVVRMLKARELVDQSRQILESEPEKWLQPEFLAWRHEARKEHS